MINLSRLFGRFDKRKQIDFASDARTQVQREEIDKFLYAVLPVEEHEFIESYFISDDATILDCSMAHPQTLIENCERVYGVRLTLQDLRMSLNFLAAYVTALRS